MSTPLFPTLLVALLAATLSACGSHVISLVSPDTSPGTRYQCQRGRECIPGRLDGPTARGGPDEIRLPEQCAGKVHEITIVNPDSSDPEVHVTCAQ